MISPGANAVSILSLANDRDSLIKCLQHHAVDALLALECLVLVATARERAEGEEAEFSCMQGTGTAALPATCCAPQFPGAPPACGRGNMLTFQGLGTRVWPRHPSWANIGVSGLCVPEIGLVSSCLSTVTGPLLCWIQRVLKVRFPARSASRIGYTPKRYSFLSRARRDRAIAARSYPHGTEPERGAGCRTPASPVSFHPERSALGFGRLPGSWRHRWPGKRPRAF